MAESIFSRVWMGLRKRLGLIKVITIYQYVVRASGRVMSPTQKKVNWAADTRIQFELSFEDDPFFRTITDNFRDAQKRFEADIVQLVKDQEKRIEQLPVDRSPFAWNEKVSKEEISEITLKRFLRFATEKEKIDYEKTGQVKKPAKPTFLVTAVDFEMADSFQVTSDKLKSFESQDTGVFKLYRWDDEHEDEDRLDAHWSGRRWKVEYLHAL
jgi:hypothetical protein